MLFSVLSSAGRNGARRLGGGLREGRWLFAKQRQPRPPDTQPAESPQRPALRKVSQFLLLEREVELEHRPRMLEALQGKPTQFSILLRK
jgi:hypothetical protein